MSKRPGGAGSRALLTLFAAISSDACGGRFGFALDRLAEALSKDAQLGQLFLSQVLVSIGQVQHGVVEPVLLMLRKGVDDPAAENMTEHLVTGLGKGHRIRITLGLL